MKTQLVSLLMIAFQLYAQPSNGIKAVADTSDTFKLVKSDKHVALYERWIRHADGKACRELRAEFVIEAAFDAILSLLRDDERNRYWNKNLAACRIIAGGQDQWVAYYRYAIPWPVNDQDCAVQYTVHRELNHPVTTIQFNSVAHNDFPVQPNVTRMEAVSGRWELEAVGNQRFSVRYYVTTAPNQSLPRWVTDPLVRGNLVASMTSFRNLAEGNG
jgi:hypothetical protein